MLFKTLVLVALLTADLYFAQNSQNFDFLEKILIKKPYIKEYDPPVIVEVVSDPDQLSQSCPLPYNSSSTATGCACDFPQKNVNCFFSNKLTSFPTLVKPSSDNSTWSVDLRCKNFTTFSSFSAITTLERVETLDLSVSPDSRQTCYVYDEIKRANYSLESLNASLTLLKSVGSPNEAPTSPKTISLTVALLNLRANQIERFTLTRNAFALSQNSRVFIHSIDLDHNLVRDLHVFTHMDICFYGVHNVTLAHNRLTELDVGFLVMLRHLSVKHNRISSFRIDFFERDKQARAHASCITTSRLNRTFVVFDSVLTSLDFSHNRLASLPFSYLTNVNFGLVESLNFSRNRVGSLKNYEFNGMKKLSHLMLDGNNI